MNKMCTCFILVLLLLHCSCESKSENKERLPVGGKEIPLGGNSYVTSVVDNGTVVDEGFSGWSSPETVLSTFFRVNSPGALNLYLKYNADTGGNVIRVTCKGNVYTVTLPEAKVEEQTLYLGSIKECPAGYVRVDFQGEKRNGSEYAAPSTLIVDGTATLNMSYVDDFSYYWGRRGPSVHINYTIPVGVTAEWFYNEVTVPAGSDPIGSYFMSNGFGEGYFGIQVNSATERRVLFSVWSPFKTDDPDRIPEEHKVKLVKKGTDVTTGEFGNEGAGGQSFLRFNWKSGTTYKFLTHVRPADNGYSEYTSYFFAPEVGNWKLIAQFLRPGSTTYYVRPHSFLENFDNNKGYLGRKAYYSNQWIYTKEGTWIELNKGKFTADATAQAGVRRDYKGGADDSGFFLQNCGFFDDYTTINTSFERTPTQNQPEIVWDDLE